MQTYSKRMMARLIAASLLLGSLIFLAHSPSMAVVPVCASPGLLNGLWQKSIDNNTVEIQPGCVEIGGIIYYQQTPAQITLSGNLRTGETEQPSTYYYLYTIMSNSGTLFYGFSSVQPTMNQFGTTGIDFESADPNTPLYHPLEGLSWRYIGQVYNDASSNIVPFDKVKPGYWESSWTPLQPFGIPIPGVLAQFLNHGLAKIPNTMHMLCSQASDGSNPAIPPSFYWDKNCYIGFHPRNHPHDLQDGGVLSKTLMPVAYGAKGIYYDTAWRTSGYYKLILTQ